MRGYEAAVCWPCVVGLHEECFSPELTTTESAEPWVGEFWVRCCCFISKDAEAHEFAVGVGRPVADPADITDITSTGRRRAQMMYPIMTGMLCEWSGLKFAGGGVRPIVGCNGNTIEARKDGPHAGHRHHGPNKNVIDNAASNVHRICTQCHNRYHALNNEFYVGPRPPADQPWMPTPPEGETLHRHDSETSATDEDYEESEAFWKTRKVSRVDTED